MIGVSIQLLAGRVINSIPEGLLLALFAWLLLRLVGRQNSGTRFAVWFVALLAIASLPFLPSGHLRESLVRGVQPEITLPASWAVAVLSGWGLLAFFGIARLAFGLMRLSSLRRSSVPIDVTELAPVVQTAVAQSRQIRNFQLRASSEVRVPTAIGFFRPVILLPAWGLDELSSEELTAVVLHEFAHLQRRDDWTNFAQKVVRALLFFHPAVLWVDRRLSLEREMACDDAVLASTRNPGGYARCLLSLAEKSFVRRTVALAQAAVGRVNETSQRIAQILDAERPTTTRVFKPVLVAVASVVALGIAVIPYAPRLVGFQDPASLASATETGVPEVPQSMIVPAMARVEPHAALPAKATIAKAVEHKVVRASRPTSRREDPAYLAAAIRKQRPPVPQAQYVVFTETTDYYQHGDAIIGVSTWRVTLVNAPVKAARLVEPPKQT